MRDGSASGADAEGSGGKRDLSAGELLPLVYDELRVLAQHRLGQEGAAHTIQATALVHEAYVRLAGPVRFANTAHFFKVAAEAMRRILIDHARGRGREKRGGEGVRVPLTSVLDLAAAPDSEQIVAFDEAICRLEEEAALAASVVRLRFYAGLSIDETAESLGISARTVDREWRYARAWLFRALEGAK